MTKVKKCEKILFAGKTFVCVLPKGHISKGCIYEERKPPIRVDNPQGRKPNATNHDV